MPAIATAHRRSRFLYLSLLLLLALGLAMPAQAESTRTWEPFAGLDRQLFPSLIVATAAIEWPGREEPEERYLLGDPYGMVGAFLPPLPKDSQVRLVVRENRFMHQSSARGQIEDAKAEYDISPRVNWKYEALLKMRQVLPLSVVMELFVDGKSRGVKSVTAVVRSLNDCPFYLPPTDEKGMAVENEADAVTPGEDLGWMFAAYVNESHPVVEQIIREALDAGLIDAFTGYQTGEPERVIHQVYAVWNVLERRGMRYSDIKTPSAESSLVLSQHVRLLDETVAARQANCVDGTVLMASVLRKIGLEPYLLLLPGHMILAFDLDAEGKEAAGLETTMLGQEQSPPPGSRTPPGGWKKFDEASWKNFEAALADGTDQLQQNAARFDSDNPADAEYQAISVSEARLSGVLPLSSIR